MIFWKGIYSFLIFLCNDFVKKQEPQQSVYCWDEQVMVFDVFSQCLSDYSSVYDMGNNTTPQREKKLTQ